MSPTRTAARMADHAIAAIHGGAWKPTPRQIAERAVELAETLQSFTAPGAPPISEEAHVALEDAAWEARKAVQAWLQDQGIPVSLQIKLGRLL